MGRTAMNTKFWWGKLKENDHSRPRRRCENNIKFHLSEARLEDLDWINLAQDRER
jgi:hypothetical protein